MRLSRRVGKHGQHIEVFLLLRRVGHRANPIRSIPFCGRVDSLGQSEEHLVSRVAFNGFQVLFLFLLMVDGSVLMVDFEGKR